MPGSFGCNRKFRDHFFNDLINSSWGGLGVWYPREDIIFDNSHYSFFCDVVVGQAKYGKNDINQFIEELESDFISLAEKTNARTLGF
jgi:hypothetical protein